MVQQDLFPPTRDAALARIAEIRPQDYARSRNAINGAVTQLSPYITHGFVSLPEVLAGVAARHRLDRQHKFVFELGWREYFRHVWRVRGSGIFDSLHQGVLPDREYASGVPADIRQARTGVPAIDMAVRTLYGSGTLHNHARMWLASYLVHIRKVHWRAGADWLYGHLLDGDLASNHLSWQWVAGTGSNKPYLFNAENVARYAPPEWHSPGSVIDASYEDLGRIAALPHWRGQDDGATTTTTNTNTSPQICEPSLCSEPGPGLGLTAASASGVEGLDVWLVHPWSLGKLPERLPPSTRVIGIFVADFHRERPWSEQRWQFVARRMADITTERWFGSAHDLAAALKHARSVACFDEPHLAPWLSGLAACEAAPTLFSSVERRCDSFSQWWTRVQLEPKSADDLGFNQQVPLW